MTFQRHEIKYLLKEHTYQQLRTRLEGKTAEDQYGKTTICNIYFDTPDARLVRNSLEKPVDKEKLRLRSYGVPEKCSEVFAELFCLKPGTICAVGKGPVLIHRFFMK